MVYAWLLTQLSGISGSMTAQRARVLAKNERGMIDVVELILLGVGIFVVGYLLPMGITTAINANTTGWDPTVKTLWTVFWPLMAVLVVVIYLVKKL